MIHTSTTAQLTNTCESNFFKLDGTSTDYVTKNTTKKQREKQNVNVKQTNNQTIQNQHEQMIS